MEKRLKYLLGFLVVGIGLLFNKSFGYYILNVEGVTLPLTDSNFNSSSSYQYTFKNNPHGDTEYGITTYVGWLGYSTYYNSQYFFDINKLLVQDRSCDYSYSGVLLNNSMFDFSPYTGTCYGDWQNVAHYDRFYFINYIASGSDDTKINVFFGNNNNFGKTLIKIGNDVSNSKPVYSFGGFFSGLDYKIVHSDVIGYSPLRLFFEQNVNLSSPLDGYNVIEGSGSNMTGSIAWEYYTPNNAVYRTKYQTSDKYIIDYGREGVKGVHFGSYGMGYTYGIKLSIDDNELYRGNWSFGTIGSRCIKSAMQLGLTDFDTLTKSACSNLGLLVLKGISYTDRNNNASVIILGKNPNNTKQILYQQFDCADDDLLRIMNSGDDNDGFCSPISHGYITHSGSNQILPFADKMTSYTIGSGNEFLDFFFSGGLYGYTEIEGNQYCMYKGYFNSNNSLYSTGKYCFGLTATPQLKSLKEMYLDNGGDLAGNGGTVGGQGLDDVVINNPSWYYTYSGLVEYAMSGDFYVEEDTNYIENYTDYVFINGVPQLKNLKFGVCPFTTNSNFATLGMTDFSFDILVPHKCILAGLQAGYTSVNMSGYDYMNLPVKFVDDTLNHENAGLIGHFVAILLILGISYLLFYFLKIFK